MPLDPSAWPLPPAAAAFLLSALVILIAGVKLARVADQLAGRTGLGEVVAGALFVGITTSLPGSISTLSAAASGQADLAVGIAVGGIAFQTAALVIADAAYRHVNLEHAAASATGLAQSVLLIVLLTIPIATLALPPVTFLGIHPATIILFITYAMGLRLLISIKKEPMWEPVRTRESERRPPPDEEVRSSRRLWTEFLVLVIVTAPAGWVIGETSSAIAEQTFLSETAAGALLAGVSTSLPELVTAVAAVRRGAVKLALGDIIGGNSFDVLFLAGADLFYREGSIYHSIGNDNLFNLAVATLMIGTLTLGLIRREKGGPGGIGFESVTVLALYVGCVVVMLALPGLGSATP